ncbi:MAG: HlyD family secretion protein [Pseudomonadota bacterium]
MKDESQPDDRRDDAPDAASETAPDTGSGGETQPERKGGGELASLRRITLAAMALLLIVFCYSVVADRMTPFASDARAQAFVLRIATELNGRVEAVSVADNSVVEEGDELFRIDPTPFQIAVEQAKARLDQAGQNVDASTSAIQVSEAQLAEARANEANVRAQSARVLELVERGVYAKAREDDALSAIDAARAGVESAEADLERAREELGPQGADNPQVLDALASLRSARYDLSRTRVVAPSRGVVTNLQLAGGQTVTAGQPAMTFISDEDAWLLASMRENSLGVLEAGQAAEVVFDALPGQVFPASVNSVGWGIANEPVDPNTGLPKESSATGWLTDPQRFPVILHFDEENPPRGVRYGSRAAVIVYARNNLVMDALAWLRIRLIALVTYVS